MKNSIHNNRILIVDDNREIHEDFRKILGKKVPEKTALDDFESAIFEDEPPDPNAFLIPEYTLDFASQGKEALNKVIRAEAEGRPYALVFMDVRMPPGWDGVRTIKEIWSRHPYIEMVIVSAHADYTWVEIYKELGPTDRLLFLRKPFDTFAIKQMASSLTKKWELSYFARKYVSELREEIETAQDTISKLEGFIRSKTIALEKILKDI